MARPLFDSEYIFGIHEPGGENHMLDAGKPGWVLFTEGVGHNPSDQSGKDFRPYSVRGLGVICRLNNGYHPQGTIPIRSRYADFARRCANYVAASPGCKIWIIGNEMNYAIERPQLPAAASAPAIGSDAAPAQTAEEDGSDADAQTETGRDEGDARQPQPSPWRGLADLWRAFARAVSRGMGDAEIGQPAEEAGLPEAVAPESQQADAAPDDADPYQRGSPGRFSALHAQHAPVADDGPPIVQLPRPSQTPRAGGEAITPEMYAHCYRLCRDAIHGVPGHADDQVLVGAVAPWNNQTTYAGNPSGDWVHYLRDILLLLGPDGCDGVTLHTYTHQADPNLIHSDVKMGPPFQNYHYEFRAYRDFMAAFPASMRHLPVYITETDQDVAWHDQNHGWIQRAYGEIDAWNRQPGNQQIRSLILYRWPKIDKWYIEGKQGIVDDFRQALGFDYRWRITLPPSSDFAPGDELETTDIVNLRRTPGYLDQPADDLLVAVPAGGRVTVLNDRARNADGLIWWNVAYLDHGAEQRGWLAQFSPDGVSLLRAVEGAEPPDPDEIAVGSRVKTLDIVRLRRTPGYANKPADDVVADLPQGTEMGVVAGPRSVDGLTWWNVRGVDAATQPITGWVAEAAPNGVRLLAQSGAIDGVHLGSGGTPDQTIAKGDKVRTLDIVRLRRSPGYAEKPDSDIVVDLPLGTVGLVQGAPRRADNLTWWELSVANDGTERVRRGWVAEFAPGGARLLAPAGDQTAAGVQFNTDNAVKTTDLVRLRRSPGYQGKPDGDVVRDVPAGTAARILSGPKFQDGLTWWEVETQDAQRARGWMAGSDPTGAVLLVPDESDEPGGGETGNGSAETAFAIGELVQAVEWVRVRKTPGYREKNRRRCFG